MKRIVIGIQARSGSTRLARKAFELISGKTMLDRVIEACKKAAAYSGSRENLALRVVVLTPVGDPIVDVFQGRCDIVEGPEQDVLTRYRMALDRYDSDFVVRITGDCPLIPPYMISRLISLAVGHGYDYISNVDPRFRTSLDGVDCEVISARLMKSLHELAVSPEDREHVTLMARREPPDWANIGAVVSHFDHSHIKLSVDTAEDLERVREAFAAADGKYRGAINTYGQTKVHLI
jgi:spore coat polysaccharide biosynthesis protein SpsF (cytidylyltransferase family)